MRPTALVRAAIGITCLLATGATARAQSLADVAREEAARRKAIKQPAKVYTNKDLVSVPAPAAASAPTPTDGANPSSQQPSTRDEKAESAAASSETTNAPPEDHPRDQAYWSVRQQELQAQLDRDRVLVDALQSHINGLTADFTARDDPAQRAVIWSERQKAMDELDRLNQTVVKDQKSIADFQEEARRASVPPGWLR
jgi:hypothetical protein